MSLELLSAIYLLLGAITTTVMLVSFFKNTPRPDIFPASLYLSNLFVWPVIFVAWAYVKATTKTNGS